MRHFRIRQSGTRVLPWLLVVAGIFAGSSPAAADDRDLLRNASGKPYVFVLLDTSGSMHWAPRCTQEQFDAGDCDFLCPDGDCYTPLNGDDPAAKLFQAKSALFEVLDNVNDVDFGFATFNQDQLYMRAKHWLYSAAEAGPTINGFGAYPPVGAQEVFGLQWACDNGNGDAEIGCYAASPADLNDVWELTRVQRLPKGGTDFASTQTFYVRSSGTTYRVRYSRASGTLGDATISVRVRIDRCDNGDCSSRTAIADRNVAFNRLSDFDAWDFSVRRTASQLSYFSQGQASDSPASNTCSGWDPNTDSTADEDNGYSIRWPTTLDPDPALRPFLNRGDVLPLSWQTDNKQAILERLAPNLALGETDPDFRVARYFQDTPNNGHLLLRNAGARPILAFGATPLGASVASFRTWYTGCATGNCPDNTGWRDLAATHDPDWGCRPKFLLILTDGDETCGGEAAACDGALALKNQEGVKTYVVAFGVPGGGNVLTCMAQNGGTAAPVYPQNKQQLINALTQIFSEISEKPRSFASAAVPSVQAQIADKIYLTSFTPLNNASIWPARVDAYLKPLPLTEAGTPDRDRDCTATIKSSCHLWDAGEVLLTQAPTGAEADLDQFKLGTDPSQRRLYYPLAAVGSDVPRVKRLFEPPSTPALWLDLWTGLGVPYDLTDTTPAENATKNIIRFALRQKVDTVDNPDGTTTEVTYVLGDVFHATPGVVSNPNRFRYFTSDLYGNASTCTDTTEPNKGYRCFYDRARYRRKMLIVGSDDNQLHVFDAGIFSGSVVDGQIQGEFDNGGGQELFSIIPRPLLPKVRAAVTATRQDWGVDGTSVIDDVFIDPSHDGTPTPDDRQWRTVMIGGYREGGSGYYAVDVTQPDKFQAGALTAGLFLPEPGPGYVPSCLSGYTSTDCGPVEFPSVLWEFVDSEIPDEDQNGHPDLGETWSIANTGRIRVIENGETVDKFVAIVGGGMDPDKVDQAGDWLYIIDFETGKAIYKRQLVGSAPSEPAAVDADQDGYLDTIYIGTTAGFLYKVDIGTPAEIEDVVILGTTVHRIANSTVWEPFPIFTTSGRPIYFPPAVIFVARLGQYALGFGTGDREDLWSTNGQSGRFYLILDQSFTPLTPGLPLDETSYQAITPTGAQNARDFLLNPNENLRPGWHIDLAANERVITKAFSLSGVTTFTAYTPESLVEEAATNAVCSRSGQSRVFVIYTSNANAVLNLEGSLTRYWLVPEFVTDPYTEQSATKNPPSEGGNRNADQLNDDLRNVMETLRGLYPDNCRFANFTLNIKTVRSDTGAVFIAPVPICIVEKNWREF